MYYDTHMVYPWKENVSVTYILTFHRAHYFADGGGSQNSSLRCHVFSTSLGAVLHELGHCLGLVGIELTPLYFV